MAHCSHSDDTAFAVSQQAGSCAQLSGEHAPVRHVFSGAVLGFSWLLVMAIGLLPLAEASLNRPPSLTVPSTIAFFIAVGSGILLRRQYSWVGVVMHIYGQIAIWLSLFVMSLAIVLTLAAHG